MEWLKDILGEEIYNQVVEKLKDNKDVKLANLATGEYVGKGKYDALETQVKDLKGQLKNRDTQLDTLKNKSKDNEDLEAEIEKLKGINKQAKKDYENKLLNQQKDFAITEALRDVGAKNQKAVMALLDLEVIKVDGKDLIGLNEQLVKIKESDGYLFGEDGPGVGGREPHAPGKEHKNTTKNPWSKEHYNLTEQGKLIKEDPELAKQLMAQV